MPFNVLVYFWRIFLMMYLLQEKKEYADFCANEHTLPIFMQNWWLDAVCKNANDWQPIFSKDKNGIIDAVLICHTRKKYFLKKIGEPPLTQFSGVWFREKTNLNQVSKRSEKYFFIKKNLDALIDQIPRADIYFFRLQYTLTDAQPFFWKGFQTLVRYTYRLENIKNFSELQTQMNNNTRRNIKRGLANYDLEFSEDWHTFVQLNNTVFARQEKNAPINNTVWKNLDEVLSEHNARMILFARNKTTQTIDAGVYIVFDFNTAYYLAGGCNDSGRENGGLYFCLWNAIQTAAKRVDIFDFEGSMLKNIEPVFRGFGGIQTPYLTIQKTKNIFLRILNS